MIASDLMLIIPETALLGLACLVLIADTFIRDDSSRSITYISAQTALIIVICLLIYRHTGSTTLGFGNSFISDPMSIALKLYICSITVIIFIYSQDYLKTHGLIKGEYYVLGLFAVLGMMIMVSAHSLLTVYLGLELLSLSLYAMIAMHRTSDKAIEAAIKYFVLGALASGMLLYGISIIYGITGTLTLNLIAEQINLAPDSRIYFIYGMIFIIIGIAFKLGAAPFHMWLPDVYQGAPTSVTLFISAAPKIAAFAMAIRLLVNGLLPLADDWRSILILLAVLSMGLGNIIAISQTNIKRMLAYSTIAHAGFILLGLIAGNPAGFAGGMFYVLTYALMSMGAFGIIILLGNKGFEADNLDDFKGLAQRNPWFSFIMMCLMFSMAGVPPFVGFWAKWFVLKELVASGLIWLAAVAVGLSIIGAFYYLRIIKLMYFDAPLKTTRLRSSQGMEWILSLNGLAILILGLIPNTLMVVCISALSG